MRDITWCYCKYPLTVLPPCKASNPTWFLILLFNFFVWSVMAERSSALDSSSGVVRMWVRIPAWPVAALVSLSKTLNHNCFVLRMGHKAVGPVCCVMHVKEPRTKKRRLACPGVSGYVRATNLLYYYYYYYYLWSTVYSVLSPVSAEKNIQETHAWLEPITCCLLVLTTIEFAWWWWASLSSI